jgi:2'-5' RNA ligase
MTRRLFIAILIPEEIKQKLLSYQKKLWSPNLRSKFGGRLRWVRPENIHLTLAFLDYTEEEKIGKIKEILKELSPKFPPSLLNLNKISLGPDPKRPRLIWVEGQASEALTKLAEVLRKELDKENIFFDKKYSFKVHLTLARARNRELFGGQIEQRIDLTFQVKEIALMESQLKKEGAEYSILYLTNLCE